MPAGSTRKTVKNRLHLDLTTSAEDREAELGEADTPSAPAPSTWPTGQESWDVLADPEGNEFCVVRPKSSLIG